VGITRLAEILQVPIESVYNTKSFNDYIEVKKEKEPFVDLYRENLPLTGLPMELKQAEPPMSHSSLNSDDVAARYSTSPSYSFYVVFGLLLCVGMLTVRASPYT
jgi:hypothetical protein